MPDSWILTEMHCMSHTPGPWLVREPEADELYEVYAENGGDLICYPVYTRNQRDNIHLIAAAPDLLSALKLWMELETTCDGRRPCYCDDPEIARHGKCYACIATAAILKAEGVDE